MSRESRTDFPLIDSEEDGRLNGPIWAVHPDRVISAANLNALEELPVRDLSRGELRMLIVERLRLVASQRRQFRVESYHDLATVLGMQAFPRSKFSGAVRSAHFKHEIWCARFRPEGMGGAGVIQPFLVSVKLP